MPPTWESRFRQVAAGVIEAGANVRATSAELWAELRPRLAEADLPIGQAGFGLVMSMWHGAAERRRSAERFAKANPEQLFDPSMAAPEMNMRSAMIRNMEPQYLARFDLTYVDRNGETVTSTFSMRDTWRPGMTVGDVQDEVLAAAEGRANEYGQSFVGVRNVRPVTI